MNSAMDLAEILERYKAGTQFSEVLKDFDFQAALDIPALVEHVQRLQKWIDDLQSGMFINCVYCGHRYGPGQEVAATMREALYEHVKVCPRHPLSAALARVAELEAECREAWGHVEKWTADRGHLVRQDANHYCPLSHRLRRLLPDGHLQPLHRSVKLRLQPTSSSHQPPTRPLPQVLVGHVLGVGRRLRWLVGGSASA